MTLENHKTELNELLEQVVRELDIKENMYDSLEQSYKAVGTYLGDDSELSAYHVEIHPQGSLLLGTAIRPISDDDDVDIDLVCELRQKKPTWTQCTLKNKVGDRLKESKTYKPMLKEEGRRCWTILYRRHSDDPKDRYHLDVLPTVFDNTISVREALSVYSSIFQGRELWDKLSMRLTDNKKPGYYTDTYLGNWMKTNPFGYALWFEERCKTTGGKTGVIMARSKVSPMRPYTTDKVPLQRVVQLLKRHRDLMFNGDEDKPISIIITTLAAYAYNGEDNLLAALNHISKNMEFKLHRNASGHYVISNPVNPEENFADKWVEYPEREVKFFQWVRQLQNDINALINPNIKRIELYNILKRCFGDNVTTAILSREGTQIRTSRENGTLKASAISTTATASTMVHAHTFFGK